MSKAVTDWNLLFDPESGRYFTAAAIADFKACWGRMMRGELGYGGVEQCPEEPRVAGTRRSEDDPREIVLRFTRRLTDDELRVLHEYVTAHTWTPR